MQHGRVRLEDQLGNAEADTVADLGRRHQSEVLIDAKRRLLKVRSHWYPIMLQLHRFIIAVATVTVNHDGRGGTAPDPLVWDQDGPKKARKLGIWVIVDLASLPGPPGFLSGPWIQVHGGCISGLTVLASSANFLLSLVPIIGQRVLMTWAILGFLFWNFLSYLRNGLDIGCSVKRLPDLMLGLTVLFWFPVFLCQRESKFDMVVSSS